MRGGDEGGMRGESWRKFVRGQTRISHSLPGKREGENHDENRQNRS